MKKSFVGVTIVDWVIRHDFVVVVVVQHLRDRVDGLASHAVHGLEDGGRHFWHQIDSIFFDVSYQSFGIS